MGNISIDHENVAQMAAALASRARVEVLSTGTVACNKMLGVLEVSSGEFADSLRAEIEKERAVIQKTGNLLIALADYIQTVSKDFETADQRHQRARVSE